MMIITCWFLVHKISENDEKCFSKATLPDVKDIEFIKEQFKVHRGLNILFWVLLKIVGD